MESGEKGSKLTATAYNNDSLSHGEELVLQGSWKMGIGSVN